MNVFIKTISVQPFKDLHISYCAKLYSVFVNVRGNVRLIYIFFLGINILRLFNISK